MSFSSKISDFWSNLVIKIENLRKILKFLIKKLRICVKIEHQFLIFSSSSTYFKPVTWGRLGCRFRFEKQKIQVQVTGLGLIFLTGWAKPQVEIGLRRLQVQTLKGGYRTNSWHNFLFAVLNFYQFLFFNHIFYRLYKKSSPRNFWNFEIFKIFKLIILCRY